MKNIDEKVIAVNTLLASRGSNFSDASHDETKVGGTRDLFKSSWGPNGEVGVLAKADKEKVYNPRAERHMNRGYNTKNELAIMAGSYDPGTARIIDYFDAQETAKVGLSGTVVIEEEIPNATSLENSISTNGALGYKAFVDTFSSGVRTLKRKNDNADGKGVFHRDIKPSNWLVRENPAIEEEKSVIIDWANASRKENVQESYLPTSGGRSFTDPLLMGPFTDKDSTYNDQSEIYSTVGTMMFSARGKPVFNYDSDTTKAISWDTGRTVLKDGKIDQKEHDKVLKKAIKSLPRDFRKFGDLFYRSMTLDEGERFGSFEEFANEYSEVAGKKSLLSRIGKGAAIAAGIALPIVGVVAYQHVQAQLEESQNQVELKEKSLLIKNYLNGNRHDVRDIITRNELSAWEEKFDDKKTAVAAFLNPEVVYRAVQENGSSNFDSIRNTLWREDSNLSIEMSSLFNQAIDNWMWSMDNKGKEKVNEKWEEAKRIYEKKQEVNSISEKHPGIFTVNAN